MFDLQSTDTKEIAAALAKAQGQIGNAIKDKTNPHLKNKYATLAAVINATSAGLSANGISVVQATLPVDGTIMVVTTLHHASGQWFRSFTPLVLAKNDMQGLGSAISYARRYALSAIVGISQADDDGNAASGKPSDDYNDDTATASTSKPSTSTKASANKKADPPATSAPVATAADARAASNTGECKCGGTLMRSKFGPGLYCPSCKTKYPEAVTA